MACRHTAFPIRLVTLSQPEPGGTLILARHDTDKLSSSTSLDKLVVLALMYPPQYAGFIH